MRWERYGGLRAALAQLAAQIMYGEDVKQYFTAKRLAAKRWRGRARDPLSPSRPALERRDQAGAPRARHRDRETLDDADGAFGVTLGEGRRGAPVLLFAVGGGAEPRRHGPVDLRVTEGAGQFSFMHAPPPGTVEPLVDRDGFLDGLVRDVVAFAAP